MSGPGGIFLSGEIWLPSKGMISKILPRQVLLLPQTAAAFSLSTLRLGLPNVVGMYQQRSSQAHDTVYSSKGLNLGSLPDEPMTHPWDQMVFFQNTCTLPIKINL